MLPMTWRLRDLVLLALFVAVLSARGSRSNRGRYCQCALLRAASSCWSASTSSSRSRLNLINGITGQFSIGHAGFMAVGAYVGGVRHDDVLAAVP